eukprot:354767-Chlamydomonas_euryale.AAC.2
MLTSLPHRCRAADSLPHRCRGRRQPSTPLQGRGQLGQGMRRPALQVGAHHTSMLVAHPRLARIYARRASMLVAHPCSSLDASASACVGAKVCVRVLMQCTTKNLPKTGPGKSRRGAR